MKLKRTKIYSKGFLVSYTKICTSKKFPLYGILWYEVSLYWPAIMFTIVVLVGKIASQLYAWTIFNIILYEHLTQINRDMSQTIWITEVPLYVEQHYCDYLQMESENQDYLFFCANSLHSHVNILVASASHSLSNYLA